MRRDLRLEDAHALHAALESGDPVLPLFIFDTDILDKLDDPQDRRVDHIHRTLRSIKEQLEAHGSSLLILHGKPQEVWDELVKSYDVRSVHTARDHEPYAIRRDKAIADLLADQRIPFHTHKDQTIFERDEVLKDDGTPYTVYTPFMRKWRSLFDPAMAKPFDTSSWPTHVLKLAPLKTPSLADIGFQATDVNVPAARTSAAVLQRYQDTRDRPDLPGTSQLSVHLRFGTVSVRQAVRWGLAHSEAFLNELIWREFFMCILYHFPHVEKGAFRPKYDAIRWEDREDHFEAWCEGRTGYPMVDAGMRELNATGLMHNRVRMVVASFLTKHLLIDWRWGEAYFAAKLLDFELASNNGNWQWAAGCGCDAAPYFRVFNPELQFKRFDPNAAYVHHWVPEYGTDAALDPIIDHKFARQRAIDRYNSVLKKGKPVTRTV